MVGISFVVLVAGAAVAAYLVFGTRAKKTADVLPTRVLSTQAVGLVVNAPAAAGGGPGHRVLIASSSNLGFTAGGPPEAAWTSDQMAGGTYILIYLQNGLCLAPKPVTSTSVTPVPARAVVLRRCSTTQASQRWVRQNRTAGAGGLDYWQLRNLGNGRCLTAGSGGSSAQLAPCAATPGPQQLVAFVTMP
jgi:hypothetical protein